MKASAFLLTLALLYPQAGAMNGVQVLLTTGDQSHLLTPEQLNFTPQDPNLTTTIEVNKEVEYQTMEGVGAALTESSAHLIHSLSPEKQKEVLEGFFDPQKGIGMDVVRLPIGASDFALGNYTHNDLPWGETDPELKKFSLQRDQQAVIPTLQQALGINKDLTVVASPWSAPAWMKVGNSRTAADGLGKGRLNPEFESSYAQYFVKFIQGYWEAGIPIHLVTVQNEPHHESYGYPTMRMEFDQQGRFVSEHLRPALDQAGLKTGILVWDHNWNEPDYPLAVLSSEKVRQSVAGTAWHCYGGDVSNQSIVHDRYPELGTYFTECSGGEWSPQFSNNLMWTTQNLLIGATRNWAKTVLMWNLALDEEHGPTNGGCGNCRGVITLHKDGTLEKNVETYLFSHYGKVVRKGAKRIESTTKPGEWESVAFQNPDGSLALIVMNPQNTPLSFQVNAGQHFQYSLPAQSVATFHWQPPL
ncbi:glycoside hydrolase family 30 protein [Deinococcus misasensis]|uniref:glycoside hydrolase family 30 protein n=1 Tax=Deinococcus misasensis TaxID=392413 RepID=UPI00055465DD|nr:glycoside hydrolase family 30 beta sandwich domain-containing protein [Deinococcus misasensis]